MHLEGTDPEILVGVEDDWLLEKKGTAEENASVEENRDPRVELQQPGVSHLATLEEAGFFALSSPPPIDSGVLVSSMRGPSTQGHQEQDRGADLEPPSHDTPPAAEAAELQAPTKVRGPLESLQGEA